VLPTFLAVSGTDAGNVLFSLLGFVVFYSALLIVDVFLLTKYIRLGPDETLGHTPTSEAA
jgi:cytochrome d ubiquinol oxidase subunit I